MADDLERSQRPLKAVHVCTTNNGDEYHEVGQYNVTDVRWSWTNGHMARLLTVQVFKDGRLHSEHPFSNFLGVYYR